MTSPEISFVIPAKDEQDSVLILYQEISQAVKKIKKSYEVIFIDDGSQDQTYTNLQKILKKDKRVRVIQLRGNFGKSIALQVGFEQAKGEIIFTLDADLQDNPAEIMAFIKELDKEFDLVSGWKKKRFDPISKKIPSKMGNFLARVITGVNIHDFNCGFKAYRREVVQNLTLYGELYKFIPVLAAKQNFRVTEIVIGHRPRQFGKSKFGAERNLKGFLDLLTVVFLTGYLRRPGHFFGGLGIIFFSVGFTIGLFITYLRLTTGTIQDRGPLLFLGMLFMIIGVQLVSTGLLAEMFVNFNQKQKALDSYIKEILN